MPAHSSRPAALLVALVVTLLALADPAGAGGHRPPPTQDMSIRLDPEQQSDRTGTVLITGANRGIGLELARNYAERGWTVIATARKPDQADALNTIADQNPKLTVVQLDVLDHDRIDALARQYADTPIDVLLNNAAILGEPNDQNFGDFDYDLMQQVFAVNVVGPMKMAEAFADSVGRSEQKKMVAITSAQGSITSTRSPSIVFYNLSKSALNMAMKSNAAALKKRGITVALISPGAVNTDMMQLALDRAGVKFPLLTPAQSAEAVINIIDQYDLDITGTFMSHQGNVIPW